MALRVRHPIAAAANTMTHRTTPETDALSQINQKILDAGQSLPAVTLKDGTRVQTGTVATVLHNIGLYNAGQRGEVERELALAIPTLFKVGLFDLFPPADWASAGNPGRALVGELAAAYARDPARSAA